MLPDLTVKEFLAQTASGSPFPGGGSVAALSASLSASLTEMVANLTIGKKGYESVTREMKAAAAKARKERDQFIKDIDLDSSAYQQVMAAYKLRAETEKEKKQKKRAIERALKKAARIPLSVATRAVSLMELIQTVVEKGNKNARTDGIVAALMAKAAILSALCNVRTNLSSIEDNAFVEEMEKKATHLELTAMDKERKIIGAHNFTQTV